MFSVLLQVSFVSAYQMFHKVKKKKQKNTNQKDGKNSVSPFLTIVDLDKLHWLMINQNDLCRVKHRLLGSVIESTWTF